MNMRKAISSVLFILCAFLFASPVLASIASTTPDRGQENFSKLAATSSMMAQENSEGGFFNKLKKNFMEILPGRKQRSQEGQGQSQGGQEQSQPENQQGTSGGGQNSQSQQGQGSQGGGASDQGAAIQNKMKDFQQKMKDFQSKGGDMAKVQPLMQEFQDLMKQGKMDDASIKLDEVLGILDGSTGSSSTTASQSQGQSSSSPQSSPPPSSETMDTPSAGFSKKTNTKYLLFQIFTGVPDKNSGVFTSGNSKSFFENYIKDIKSQVMPQNMHNDRKLGFSIGPFAMDQTESEISGTIRDAFEIGLEKNLAVSFHLDDYMFWRNAKGTDGRKLIDGKNAEWKDWNGTPSVKLKVGWLPNDQLAPQLCYEKQAVRDAVTHYARDVVGKAVKKGVDKLKNAGKEDLFAGVVVGWESNLADGYCSLTERGFSASNPPADFDREREKILQRHMERMAKGVYDAGINKELIFTHIAPIPKKDMDSLKSAMSVKKIRDMPQSTVFRAFWTAFNKYSNPGYSLYPAVGMFDDIYKALADNGNSTWGMVEGTNVMLTAGTHSGGAGQSFVDWETYLARIYNHGGKVIVIFGGFQGGQGAYTTATESKEAIAAYKKFLRGETLVEGKELDIKTDSGSGGGGNAGGGSSGGSGSSDLPSRMKALPSKIQKFQQKGGSMSAIQSKLQLLDQHMKAGEIGKAEKVLDEIEAKLK